MPSARFESASARVSLASITMRAWTSYSETVSAIAARRPDTRRSFDAIRAAAAERRWCPVAGEQRPRLDGDTPSACPFLSEPWSCCAEPTQKGRQTLLLIVSRVHPFRYNDWLPNPGVQ